MISLSGIDSKELASISVVTEKYLISSNSKFLKSFAALLSSTIFSQVSYNIFEISILSLSPNKELFLLL